LQGTPKERELEDNSEDYAMKKAKAVCFIVE
jgi:hypothetical protein